MSSLFRYSPPSCQCSRSRWARPTPTTIVIPRSFLSPFALAIPPFRRRSHPKEGSLLCLSSSLAREIMTIAPRSLASLQLSLPPSSHFHPPSLPLAIPLFTPGDLSTPKSILPFSAPHLSRMSSSRHFLAASCTNAVLGGEVRAQELPRDVVMDRDSAFHMSHSRVLRVSLPFSSRCARSRAFLVLQPPAATVRFPSESFPRYRGRKQERTRLFHVHLHVHELNLTLSHPNNSSFPFQSPFGLAELVT